MCEVAQGQPADRAATSAGSGLDADYVHVGTSRLARCSPVPANSGRSVMCRRSEPVASRPGAARNRDAARWDRWVDRPVAPASAPSPPPGIFRRPPAAGRTRARAGRARAADRPRPARYGVEHAEDGQHADESRHSGGARRPVSGAVAPTGSRPPAPGSRRSSRWPGVPRSPRPARPRPAACRRMPTTPDTPSANCAMPTAPRANRTASAPMRRRGRGATAPMAATRSGAGSTTRVRVSRVIRAACSANRRHWRSPPDGSRPRPPRPEPAPGPTRPRSPRGSRHTPYRRGRRGAPVGSRQPAPGYPRGHGRTRR